MGEAHKRIFRKGRGEYCELPAFRRAGRREVVGWANSSARVSELRATVKCTTAAAVLRTASAVATPFAAPTVVGGNECWLYWLRAAR